MESINEYGKLRFRTKILSQAQAESFCKALQAHRSFIEVTVEESPRAKGEKRFFVAYRPSRLERQEAMRDRQQSAREERARTQTFTFVKDADSGRFYYCLSHQSGEVYHVTETSCDCWDFCVRCQPCKLSCKHVLACRVVIQTNEKMDTF